MRTVNLLASLTIGACAAGLVALSAPTLTTVTLTDGSQCSDFHGGALCAEGSAATPAQAAAVAELVKASWPTWPGRIYEDDPRWDCHTMGNRVCGPQPVTCWVEKAQSVDTAEGICGDPALRPAGAVDVGTELTIHGRPWVATVTGLEPVSAN